MSAQQKCGSNPAPSRNAQAVEREFTFDVLRHFVTGAPKPDVPDHLDWDRLERIVDSNKLTPIFRHALDAGQIPPPTLEHWDRTTIRTVLENTRIARAAAKMFSIFAEVGIPAVALRGLTLAHTVYPDAALRPMRDVDILVPSSAGKLIPGLMMSHRLKPERILRSQFVYRIDGATFEIHWRLLTPKRYRFATGFEQWLDSRRIVEMPQGTISCLAPDNEILGLVTHAFIHHELGELLSLVDIALMMTHSKVDWPYIDAWYRKAFLTNMFQFTFAFVNHLFDLGMETRPKMFVRTSPHRAANLFEAYTAPLFGEDALLHYLRRKRNLVYAAEPLPTKMMQLLRFFTADEIRPLGRIVRRRRFSREDRNEDRPTSGEYGTLRT